jgi:hypothetical protein
LLANRKPQERTLSWGFSLFKRRIMRKYTKEATETMIENYKQNPTRETVAALSESFNLSEKSIIGKLSREGVYRRSNYLTKTGEKPVTKLELVSHISEKLGLPAETLEGLEKSPKSVLKEICNALENLK